MLLPVKTRNHHHQFFSLSAQTKYPQLLNAEGDLKCCMKQFLEDLIDEKVGEGRLLPEGEDMLWKMIMTFSGRGEEIE